MGDTNKVGSRRSRFSVSKNCSLALLPRLGPSSAMGLPWARVLLAIYHISMEISNKSYELLIVLGLHHQLAFIINFFFNSGYVTIYFFSCVFSLCKEHVIWHVALFVCNGLRCMCLFFPAIVKIIRKT